MILSLTLEYGFALRVVFMFVVWEIIFNGVLWDYKQGNYHGSTEFLCKHL